MEAAAFRQAASKLIACVTGSKACQQLVKHVSSLLIYRKLIACVTGRAQDDVLEVAGDSGLIL